MTNTSKPQFRVLENGPLEITGNFIIKGKDGKVLETSKPVYLCRCGESANKPFCDGTHQTRTIISQQ